MGWSCRRDAMETLEAITGALLANYAVYHNGRAMASSWRNPNGREYFYECGRENRDGAITGSVFETISINGSPHCKRAGSFRIEGNGTFKRFACLPREVAKAARAGTLPRPAPAPVCR